jgi:hypothetical protein
MAAARPARPQYLRPYVLFGARDFMAHVIGQRRLYAVLADSGA